MGEAVWAGSSSGAWPSRCFAGPPCPSASFAYPGRPLKCPRVKPPRGAEMRPSMYRRALVALDGSEAAETIMPFILEIAGHVEVTLLRATMPVRPIVVEGAGQPMFEDPESARSDAEEYLAPLAADLRRRGVRVKTEVRRGEVAEEILKAARESKADVIAMTTHGRTGLGRLLFGSVAETVLRESELPVLLMRWTEADVVRLASASQPSAAVMQAGQR